MVEIERLQSVLLLVRRSVGWTAEEFGERIGVTRQTINNLENGRNKMTKTQYIAIRSVLDAEIVKFPDETEMLRFILDSFVDHPEKYKAKEREEMLNKANILAPAILAGASTRKDVSKEWVATTKSIGVISGAMIAGLIGIGLGATSEWLSKLMSDNKKR